MNTFGIRRYGFTLYWLGEVDALSGAGRRRRRGFLVNVGGIKT